MPPIKFIFTPFTVAGHTPIHMWDFTDTSVLFTNTGGTTPVTSDGDDINYVADKGTGGINLDTTVGTANAPRYSTGQVNGLSGAQFEIANTEGLVSQATVNLTASFAVLIVSRVYALPAPVVSGAVLSWVPANPISSVTSTLVNIVTQGYQNRSGAHGNNLDWSGYNISHAAGNNGDLRISHQSGAITTVPNDAAQSSILGLGCNRTGTSSWLDKCAILEVVMWSESAITSAEIESYVTARYGIAWTA